MEALGEHQSLVSCIVSWLPGPKVIGVLCTTSPYHNTSLRCLLLNAWEVVLAGQSQQESCAALCALADLLERGDARINAVVTAGLTHPSKDMRFASVYALGQVSEKGDSHAISDLLLRLEDEDVDVGLGAVAVLAQIVNKGDADTITILRQRIQHVDLKTKHLLLQALLQVADQNDASTISALLEHTKHSDSMLACAAVEGLAQIVKPGDAEVLQCLVALLEYTSNDASNQIAGLTLRLTAVSALCKLAVQGDVTVITALMEHAKNSDCAFACEAVKGLAQIAKPGNAKVVSCLVGLLEHTNSGASNQVLMWRAYGSSCPVRVAACSALCELSEHGDTIVIAATTALLHDVHDDVRCAALDTLRKIAKKGDRDTITMISARLEDSSKKVCKAIVAALLNLLNVTEKERVLAGLIDRLHDSHMRGTSKTNLLEALAEIAGKGHSEAISAAMARLEDPDEAVRSAAAVALAQLVEEPDVTVISALLGHLHDKTFVRLNACMSLVTIIDGGEAGAISAIAKYLSQSRPLVRGKAISAKAFAVGQDLAVSLLGRIVQHGKDDAVACVVKLLGSVDTTLRLAAVSALAQLPEKNRSCHVTNVLKCLEDCDVRIRCAAATALGQIAVKGDDITVSALKERLRDPHQKLRFAAILALRQIATEVDREAIMSIINSWTNADRRALLSHIDRTDGQ